MSLRLLTVVAAAGVLAALPPAVLAQTPPRDTSARLPSDTVRRPGNIVVPGTDLPVQLDLTILTRSERDRNLRCNSLEAFQVSSISGCGGSFLFPTPDFRFSLKSAGTVGDQLHVNVDYDAQREFDASNTVSLYWEGKPGASLRRVDVGNITFSPPSSHYLTSSLPSGNYGVQASIQLGRLNLRPIFAKQTGNVVQVQNITMGARAKQIVDRDIDDYQIEARRFFFTIDPMLFGKAYPNIDILNRRAAHRSLVRPTASADTLRPAPGGALSRAVRYAATESERTTVQAPGRSRRRAADVRSCCATRHRLLHRSLAALDCPRAAAQPGSFRAPARCRVQRCA